MKWQKDSFEEKVFKYERYQNYKAERNFGNAM